MSVKVEVNGGHWDIKRLERAKSRTKNPERAWRDVAKYMGREVNKQFRTRGANFGTPWKPLAPSTIAQKVAAGWPRQPLVRSGKLKREFTGKPMQLQKFTGKMATFGSTSDVALWQHKGTKRNGRRHIPPRTIIRRTPKMQRDVREIVRKHVIGGPR